MLYVFIVTSGNMIQLDMNLAVKKVEELKKEISKCTNFPVEDQVLLCSGGEELQSDNMVGNYHGAGTDTNPIFLFRKFAVNCEVSNTLQPEFSLDPTIADDVMACASMAPSMQALTVRSNLAQRFADCALRGKQECNILVHHQHLQQQGWAAVIANLGDAQDLILKRKQHFDEIFQKYLENRSSYQDTIIRFPEGIALLSKIPLLRKLILSTEYSEEDVITEHTLMSWFCTEPRHVLETLVENCQRSLQELDVHSMAGVNADLAQVLKNTEHQELKELKGIGERLTDLNKLMITAKSYEKDQRELCKGFFNQAQIQHARDPNVLPDICKTFQNQLELMLQNHKCLEDILTKCHNAKIQLCDRINLHVKIICQVESEMYDLQTRIGFLEKHVLSIMNKIESIRQVHMAPKRYFKLLAEVCRRREYNINYVKFSSEVSSQFSEWYRKELALRREFRKDEEKNMVDNLFPGMEDDPPDFAVKCPEPFDQKMPDVTREDLEWLKTQVPEMSSFCEVPPPDPIPSLCQAESDSAFSSNIPSSLKIVSHVFEATDLCEKPQSSKEDCSSFKVIPPSTTDSNSLPSEYASLPNEVFSLASSPFEDPLLPPNSGELDGRPRRTKSSSSHYSGLSAASASAKDVIIEEKSLESDGEEFETVDPYRSYPVDINVPRGDTRSSPCPRPTSSSDVTTTSHMRRDRSLRVTRARSDGDAISPVQERLKSSDSLLASVDFQSTEYYIDDSMPSSYTESNATSPPMRGGNRMVKSHHVLLAELQRQVEERNDALVATLKFFEELQTIKGDLTDVKTFVKDEMSEKMAMASDVAVKISSCIQMFQHQMLMEKEAAVGEAKAEFTSIENAYIARLEVESQKLHDAEQQISQYEEHLREVTSHFEEVKHEKEEVMLELIEKGEVIKKMMLENEIEFDAVKNQMKDVLQNQDSKIADLKEALSQARSEACKLRAENNDIHELCTRLEEEQKDLTKQLICLQSQRNMSEVVAELEGKLSEAMKDNAQLKKHLEELKLRIAESDTALQQKEKMREELQETINELKSECDQYKQAVVSKSRTESGSEVLNKEPDVPEDAKKSSETAQEQVQDLELLQQMHEEELEKLKSRITAENQVSFNEAINRLVKEKDTSIEDLKSQISRLEATLNAIRSYFDKYVQSHKSGGAMSQSDFGASRPDNFPQSEEYQLIIKLQREIEPLLKSTLTTQPVQNSQQHSIECQKKKFKAKELEYQRIIAKCIKLPGSPQCFQCCTRLSILSCEKNDLVLLCYDDKYRNFVIFQLGPFVHFLHTDSMQALNLKIPSLLTSESSGSLKGAQSSQLSFKSLEPSQRWAIGVVEDKEFCITKKKENRYNVPIGTKFHRVKVRPWDREAGCSIHQCHRSFQMGATSAAVTKSVTAASSDEGMGSSRDMSASSI